MWGIDGQTDEQTDMTKLSTVLQKLLKNVKTENSPFTVDTKKR